MGVVGAGFRGGLASAAEIPGTSRVVAVADVDEQAARRAVRERHPGADVHTDHRALLDRADVDAVLLITPDHTHADLACAALEAGKAVFVEKPLAITVEDCDRVLRTARATGSRLYVGHNMRHMPVVRTHFTPDYWRNYTVIGDAGRLENFGDGRRSGYAPDADTEHVLPPSTEVHAGADRPLMAEFLRFVHDGGRTDTSPVAARTSVAAGVAATASLRAAGEPHDVPQLSPDFVAYFEQGQTSQGS